MGASSKKPKKNRTENEKYTRLQSANNQTLSHSRKINTTTKPLPEVTSPRKSRKLILQPFLKYPIEEILQSECGLMQLFPEIINLILKYSSHNSQLQLLATCRYFLQNYASKVRGVFDDVVGYWRPDLTCRFGQGTRGHLVRFEKGVVERWIFSTSSCLYNNVEDFQGCAYKMQRKGEDILLKDIRGVFPESFTLKETESGWTVFGYYRTSYERVCALYNV